MFLTYSGTSNCMIRARSSTAWKSPVKLSKFAPQNLEWYKLSMLYYILHVNMMYIDILIY